MSKLIWLFAIPYLSAIALLLFPSSSGTVLKRVAVALSLLPLLLMLVFGADGWLGEEYRLTWFAPLSIEFYLKMDALSLVFVALVAVIVPTVLLISRSDCPFPKTFYSLVLFLQGLMIGFFAARDLALFTIFWEAMLFPLYFIISIWGGEGRKGAALKFLIYMIAGSALMVAALLILFFAGEAQGKGTFNLDELANIASGIPHSAWAAAIFFIAFAVKTPLFPFHAWLPDAYYEAPTSGTVLLSALLSKAGIYGFARIGLALFPHYLAEWGPMLLGLSIAGVLYGALAAWMQADFKRLLAYSSFSHVNFVLAGLFIWNQAAHEGAILQALNHGVTIAGLFIVAGWLQERLGSTAMAPFSGLAKYLPQLCWLTMIFVLSSVALPGTNNFIGELLILFGLFGYNPWLAALLGLTVILSVIYMLRWMQKVYFETPAPYQHQWSDIKVKELLIAFPLVFLIFWIGIYPAPALKLIEPATALQASASGEVA